VGAPCSTNVCANTAAASACCAPAPTFPGGYTTTLNCTSNARAGSSARASTSPSSAARRACGAAPTARAITPCRDGASEVGAARSGNYVCIPDPEGRASNDGVCIPDCTVAPSVCGATLQCNPATHTCGSCATNPALCTGGTTCNRITGECGRCSLLTGTSPCPGGQMCNLVSGRCR
jgi:hypothetical protein